MLEIEFNHNGQRFNLCNEISIKILEGGVWRASGLVSTGSFGSGARGGHGSSAPFFMPCPVHFFLILGYF